MKGWVTARAAARRPFYIYRDHDDHDVIVDGAEEEGGGRRVRLQLSDGRRVLTDWNHKLRVVAR